MKKILLSIILLFFTIQSSLAYDDCIITSNAKLTNIKIENNEVIDVYPLITLMNEKNTLIVHPLKEGSTRFCILKNNKKIIVFNVHVTEETTTIDEVEGFSIDVLDEPNFTDEENDFELDAPPLMNDNISYLEIKQRTTEKI